jgi:hypothetical protein
MPEILEKLALKPEDNYLRHIRIKSFELALREAEVLGPAAGGGEKFDLFKRANQIFDYLDHSIAPED